MHVRQVPVACQELSDYVQRHQSEADNRESDQSDEQGWNGSLFWTRNHSKRTTRMFAVCALGLVLGHIGLYNRAAQVDQ